MSGGAGEMIASAIVKKIVGQLGDLAMGEATLQWKFKGDAVKMMGKMQDLEAVMRDADNRFRRGGSDGEAVGRWITKLKSVAYDTEDVLDELDADELIKKTQPKLKLFFSGNNQLYQRITIPHKMKTVKQRVDEIEREGRKTLKLVPNETGAKGFREMNRNNETFAASSDEVMNTGMEGRDGEKDKIINLLLRREANEHISIIPIVGLGGIGKTTLAQSVFSDKRVNDFDVQAWVHVSKEFSLKKIGSAIIKSVNSSINLDNCTLQFIHDNLRNELATRRYLIVLDDLWEEDWSELDKLKLMLPHNCKGSKIIVTTRNQSVVKSLHTAFLANNICSVPEFGQINLDILSAIDCWTIMKRRAFKPGDNQSDLLEEIGREIAGRKCGGLPLVANALGHVMSELRTVEAWRAIRDTQINPEDTIECLRLSYDFMKLEFKMCFTYLAVFLKGFIMDSDRLTQQWIALGYIHAEVDGQRCINYLLGMSFLQISKPNSVRPSLVQAKTPRELTMHDLVHDLATRIMGDEFLVLDAANPSTTNRAKRRYCRHAQLINYKSKSNFFKYLPCKVRSLHFKGSKKLPLPQMAFSRSKYIRVLDISGCSAEGQSTPNNTMLPSSIHQLKLLRYLDATGLPIESLPKSFHMLQNIQTLIMSYSTLETLPDDIDKLQNLCYLDLSCSISLVKLPVSFGSLGKLIFLNLSSCSKLTKLPDNVGLKSLEHLNLSSCYELENLPHEFGKNLQNLLFLNLSNCYKITMLPESFCQLNHLNILDLSDCHDLKELPKCFGSLSELEYLNLTSCSKLQWLPESFCNMIKLKHLNLSYCVRLEKLPPSFGDLKLQILDISSSMILTELPDSIGNMASLTQFIVMSGHEYEKAQDIKKHLNLPRRTRHDVQEIGNSGRSTIVELQKLTCHELAVAHLENVNLVEDAEKVKLRDKTDLRLLGLHWEWGLKGSMLPEMKTDAGGKSVLEKLIPPRTLEQIIVVGYMSKDFPDWMCHIASYLPSLTFLKLSDLGACVNLPPFGQLPNLRSLHMKNIPNIRKITKEFYQEGRTCTKLRVVQLEAMENLEEWWTTLSGEESEEFLIPNLHKLDIMNCPKLKFLPYPPRSMSWYLNNSGEVLPKRGFRKLSSSTLPSDMHIYGDFSPDKWDRLQFLPTLESFKLSYCDGLMALPEAIQFFTSLTRLYLKSLKDLYVLPVWLGQLISLQELHIIDCRNLTYLPESMRNLSNLKKLHIWGCPSLLQSCKGRDAEKISHIPTHIFKPLAELECGITF